MWVRKTSCMWKRFYLEYFCIKLQEWKIFSKYYGWFSNYVWWNYRCWNENSSNKFYWKKDNLKTQNFYTLLTFLLITIALLIAVSIYCYLIKYQPKQKHLLLFHDTNNKLNDIIKIVVSNKVSFGKKGFKYFIGYKDAKIRTLRIFFSKNECI